MAFPLRSALAQLSQVAKRCAGSTADSAIASITLTEYLPARALDLPELRAVAQEQMSLRCTATSGLPFSHGECPEQYCGPDLRSFTDPEDTR